MPRCANIVRGGSRVRCSHACEHALVERRSLFPPNLGSSHAPRKGGPRHPRSATPNLRDCAGICSSLIRAIGFTLLVLGVAWIIVEFALKRPVLRDAPLADGQSEPVSLYWLARLLAYLLVAFLIACATASLLAAVSDARLTFAPRPSLAALPASNGCPSLRTFLRVKHKDDAAPCEAYPRAPPI